MQRIIARYVSLMVAATMTLAVSTANAGVDELPADIKNSLYNNNFLDPNQPVGESAYRDWVAKNSTMENWLRFVLRRQYLAGCSYGSPAERACSKMEGAWNVG